MTAKLPLLALMMIGCEGDIESVISEGDGATASTGGDAAGGSNGDGETAGDDANESDGSGESGADVGDSDDSPVEELGTLVGIEMDLVYETTLDGEPLCSKKLAITGTPFTGACDDCTFAFTVDSTMLEDTSAAGCTVADYLLLNTRSTLTDVVFGHSARVDVGSGATASSYADAVFVQYSVDGSAGTYGPYTRVLASADGFDGLGPFVRDGDTFEWGIDEETFTDGEDVLVDYCAPSYTASWADFALADGYTTTSDSVSCDGKQVDVWTIEVDSTMTVGLAADTTSAETAFDAKIIVMGPDGCVVATADDNTPCTFAPERYECPAIEVDLEPGTYEVLVHSMIDVCRAGVEMGEYTLTVDAPTPIRPSLDDDDIHRYDQIPSTILHEATGRLLTE